MTKVVESLPTGVENIELPSGSEDYRYYDLTGREVKASELTKGVYIRTKGGKSEKIIF